jgi:protein CWC15
VKKKDLRAELLLAEEEARNKKRKAEGKPPLAVENGSVDEEANKRRKLLQDALDLDKDDDDEDDDEGGEKGGEDKGEESEESDDDEDDTAELLRELEKIKRERAEEKERQEMEQSATQAAAREVEVATANPLLNLAAQLGQSTPGGVNTTVPGTFAVKRRWDDGKSSYYTKMSVISSVTLDLIFKNQAMASRDKPQGQFVNDLLRTEFHKYVLRKYLAVGC